MINEQNVSHPGYDLAMELLCCLSPHPAAVATLKTDFRLDTRAEVRRLLKELSRRKLDVTFGNVVTDMATGAHWPDSPSPTGRYAWVAPNDWYAVNKACGEYWQAVYGEVPAAA